jgi:hypothetical protein
MSERDEKLAGFRASMDAIDPVLDQAANYGKGIRAVQHVMHEQGQVMSAALANNHNLYHTNRKLVDENRALTGDKAQLASKLERERAKNEYQAEYIAKLEAGGGDKFRALYEQARQTLANYLHDALTSEELRQRLGDMEAQRKEIEALPERATPEEIERSKEEIPADETQV